MLSPGLSPTPSPLSLSLSLGRACSTLYLGPRDSVPVYRCNARTTLGKARCRTITYTSPVKLRTVLREECNASAMEIDFVECRERALAVCIKGRYAEVSSFFPFELKGGRYMMKERYFCKILFP